MTKGQDYLSVTDPPGTVAELYQRELVEHRQPWRLPARCGRPPPSPPATFTCGDHDSAAPQGQRIAPCSDRYRPRLWPIWVPDGFALRGHDALIVSDPTGQNHSVGIAWMETPSQFVELESSRVSVYQLRQMAERLGPFSTDDWNTNVAHNQLLLDSATTTPASGAADTVSTSTTTR